MSDCPLISCTAFLVMRGNKRKRQNCQSYSIMLYMYLMIRNVLCYRQLDIQAYEPCMRGIKTLLKLLLFRVHCDVLEQLFNCRFHLPNRVQMTFLFVVHWLPRLRIKMVRCSFCLTGLLLCMK